MTQTNYTITDAADLDNDLAQIAVASYSSTTPIDFTFTIAPADGTTIMLDPSSARAISLYNDSALSILGNGNTLDGGGQDDGLYAYSGNVTISDLTIANAVAKGGNGTGAAGGGAGLGGGLFIGSTASVTLAGVTFTRDSATGGAGGALGHSNGGTPGGGQPGQAGNFGQQTPYSEFDTSVESSGGSGGMGGTGGVGGGGAAGSGGGSGGGGTHGIGPAAAVARAVRPPQGNPAVGRCGWQRLRSIIFRHL